jgi:UDP-N-acetylglucosamine diphosphorylase/glucosamine-1-phosphate N-acetyltransferase
MRLFLLLKHMNIILFDDLDRDNLLPLTFIRPCADLRVGILTAAERWAKLTQSSVSFKTQAYLSKVFPTQITDDNLLINGCLIADSSLATKITTLKSGEALYKGAILLAARVNKEQASNFSIENFSPTNKIEQAENEEALKITAPHDIFMFNDKAIRSDFELLTNGRKSQPISDTNKTLGAENIFVEEGASIECAILNATTGPIYVGKNASIMEGGVIRGPFALCESAQTKLSAKIYGPTTVGPHSKVGGEVTRSVIMGYSNKGHDGFVGDSVIGYWCNLGADTNTSNLKNNYADVKQWNYPTQRFKKTGLQFCGLVIGDHSKCGINTMFNTGTLVGICANIFGAGFPRVFIPDFAWGGASGFETYRPSKVFETAELVYKRRGKTLTDDEKEVLHHVFNQTAELRFWERQAQQNN